MCCCSLSHDVQLFVTPWTAACQASLSFTSSWSLLRLISIELMMPSNHLVLYHPLLLLPSNFPSIRIFSNELALHIHKSAVDFLRQVLRPNFSRVFFPSTTIQKHQFCGAQLSLWLNPNIHTWLSKKTIALTEQTFVGKVMSLLFYTLSKSIIAFLPRSKHLLISWLQSLSAVILEPKKTVCNCFHFFLLCLPWNDGTGCHDLSFLNYVLSSSISWLLGTHQCLGQQPQPHTCRLNRSACFLK